jgi:hypothetical protein
LLIGFDRNANPLEIFYNVLDHDTIRVFHAMKCEMVQREIAAALYLQDGGTFATRKTRRISEIAKIKA